jgi:hypothetical protein
MNQMKGRSLQGIDFQLPANLMRKVIQLMDKNGLNPSAVVMEEQTEALHTDEKKQNVEIDNALEAGVPVQNKKKQKRKH